MYKMIEKDYMIVIWPEGQIEKDINEMIINGKTKDQVQKIISDNIIQVYQQLHKSIHTNVVKGEKW